MSHEKQKSRVTKKPPTPISKGQHELLAQCLNFPVATIRKQYSRNKYDHYIQGGQYDLEAIKGNLSKIFQPKCKHARKSQIAKKDKPETRPESAKINKPETKKEVEQYLDENIGDLSTLAIDELWRRNELEKLLMAQIKRRVAENQLIDADVVKRESFSAGLQIREGLESIADRCASLVAATNDQFECREILAKEINHILTGLADLLEVKV